MTDDNGAEHRMVLAFDSDDPEFVRGFEAGAVWTWCAQTGGYRGTIHANNAEMVMRIAESLGLPFAAEPVGDDSGVSEEWVYVAIGNQTPPPVHPVTAAPGQDNRMRIAVIDGIPAINNVTDEGDVMVAEIDGVKLGLGGDWYVQLISNCDPEQVHHPLIELVRGRKVVITIEAEEA